MGRDSLKNSICHLSNRFKERGATFEVETSGIFSKTYSLLISFKNKHNNENITLSLDLLEDENNSNILNLDNFKTSIGKMNIQAIEKYKQRNQLMICLDSPERCINL